MQIIIEFVSTKLFDISIVLSPALIFTLKENIGYIGSLGSKKTHQKRYDRLSSLGFNENEINKIHAPIGLDIKAKTPAEIAVSVMAEIISFRRKAHEKS